MKELKRTKEIHFQVIITSLKSTRIVNTLHIATENSEYTDILNITVILNRRFHLFFFKPHAHEFYSESTTPEASDTPLNGKKVVPWPKCLRVGSINSAGKVVTAPLML